MAPASNQITAQIAGLQAQIRGQAEANHQQLGGLVAKMEQMRKPVTGRTEMDILQEVASKYRCDYEAAGMRGLIREAMTGGMLPPPKSPEETEARKAKYRQALQVDEELEQLGCRLFFARERSRHRQSERPETAT